MPSLLKFPNINNITITGRLTRDVELRYSQNNVAVAKIGIAVNHYYRTDTGESKEETSYFDCVAFGKSATICQEKLKKGSPILIEGNLRSRTYQDKNDQSRKITEIIIQKIHPLERDENYSHYDYHEAGYNRTNNNVPKPNTTIPNDDVDHDFPGGVLDQVTPEDDVPF